MLETIHWVGYGEEGIGRKDDIFHTTHISDDRSLTLCDATQYILCIFSGLRVDSAVGSIEIKHDDIQVPCDETEELRSYLSEDSRLDFKVFRR